MVGAPGFGHRHRLQMPLRTEWFSGRWKDLGRLQQSPQVLGLPPASCRGGISGAQGPPLEGRGSHTMSLVFYQLLRRGETRQARGFCINPLQACSPRLPRRADPAWSPLPATRA